MLMALSVELIGLSERNKTIHICCMTINIQYKLYNNYMFDYVHTCIQIFQFLYFAIKFNSQISSRNC